MRSGPSWLGRARRPVVLWALAALGLELLVERFVAVDASVPRAAHIALTLSPLVPSLGFIAALTRMVQQMDELQRRICLESVYLAFTSLLILVFTAAGLEQAGVYQPRWDMIGTAMMVLWAGAYIYSAWKYR